MDDREFQKELARIQLEVTAGFTIAAILIAIGLTNQSTANSLYIFSIDLPDEQYSVITNLADEIVWKSNIILGAGIAITVYIIVSPYRRFRKLK